ncbi:uncharacterized protein LOC126907962 isoform X1 [Daktulosphaira vitifoliae]|uniref:uncharacterized protein LOC126907962 isoform X1 n=1 Tax=Daktulosphaira vitifoliae TaxID=58002 RepID=UPI0021A9FFC5|nr:uncharacterized protein LOC126907962 isoform X1 [Daktulosphaira vitifoliae]
MHWQIYFELFFGIVYLLCKPIRVYSNAATGAMETLSRACEGMLTYDELSDEEKKIKERVREVLLMTNNETSFQALNIKKTYEIPEKMKAIVEKIFPKSTYIYTIRNVLNNLYEIKDEQAKEIEKKLNKFNKNEYISLSILTQILTDTYVNIPIKMVGLFAKLSKEFYIIDLSRTGKVSIQDFKKVLNKIIMNNDVIKDILKSFENINEVFYEAWLLKKRTDVNAITLSRAIMHLIYNVDSSETCCDTDNE